MVRVLFLTSSSSLLFNLYLYGNYEKNRNKINLEEVNEKIFVKIISPNFDLKYGLKNKEIEYIIVSRKPKKNMIHYTEIDEFIEKSLLIINTTPVGQYPNIKNNPKIPYKLLSNRHCCIDLIYSLSFCFI